MNVPLVCLPIALALVYASKVPLALAMSRVSGGYDNKHPREQQAKLEGWGKRAAAAHANGFESFPAFAAGVLVAQVTGANPHWAAILAVTHVVARAIYPFLYLANIDKARSTVWGVGFACSMGLLLLPLVG